MKWNYIFPEKDGTYVKAELGRALRCRTGTNTSSLYQLKNVHNESEVIICSPMVSHDYYFSTTVGNRNYSVTYIVENVTT